MDWEERSKGVISDRLRALMIYAKRPDRTDCTWTGVADALEPIYGCNIPFVWVMHHLVEAYREALTEPRFQLGGDDKMIDLLLAPVRGHTSVELLGPSSMQQKYSVEEFYGAMVLKMIGDLQITNIGWLRQEEQVS